MNLREGTRRLALLLGAAGAIAGGLFAYAQLQSTMRQRADHARFEQLANSDVVRQERDRRFPPPARLDTDTAESIAGPHNPKSDSGYAAWPSEVNKEGIKDIFWTKDLGINSFETDDGQTLYPTPAPGAGAYLLVAVLPILGFFIPWGAVRAVGWVLAGFFQPTR